MPHVSFLCSIGVRIGSQRRSTPIGPPMSVSRARQLDEQRRALPACECQAVSLGRDIASSALPSMSLGRRLILSSEACPRQAGHDARLGFCLASGRRASAGFRRPHDRTYVPWPKTRVDDRGEVLFTRICLDSGRRALMPRTATGNSQPGTEGRWRPQKLRAVGIRQDPQSEVRRLQLPLG